MGCVHQYCTQQDGMLCEFGGACYEYGCKKRTDLSPAFNSSTMRNEVIVNGQIMDIDEVEGLNMGEIKDLEVNEAPTIERHFIEMKDLTTTWFNTIAEILDKAFPTRFTESLNGPRGTELDAVNDVVAKCKRCVEYITLNL